MSSPPSGFAAAVQPIQGQTVVRTDAAGLDAGDIRIPVGDGTIAGYCARPAGRSALPTIVLAHEIWSVHEYFRDLCRRLAKAGYLAVAPDLFGRQGDVSDKDIDGIRAIVDGSQVAPGSVVPDRAIIIDNKRVGTVEW